MEPYFQTQATQIYNYKGQLKFTVNQQTMNTEAPLVREHIQRINFSHNIKHASNNILILVHVLNKLNAFQQVNCQFRPDFQKKKCQIRIYPIPKKFTPGIWPFKQHGLGFYKTNTVKFDTKFFNYFKQYESIVLGRRYNFNTHGDKHFATLRYELGEGRWWNFSVNHQQKTIMSNVRENAIKGGFDYNWYDRTREDAICYYTLGARMTNRYNTHLTYPTVGDVMSSQLYSIFAKIDKFDYFAHQEKLTFGVDPERSEWFWKFKMNLKKAVKLGQHETFVYSYALGAIYGQNILPNDKFRSIWSNNVADIFFKARALLVSRRHQILSPNGIHPFSYVQGSVHNNKLSLRDINKSINLGIGLWIPQLRTTLQCGLMEITPTTIKPSHKFLINVSLV